MYIFSNAKFNRNDAIQQPYGQSNFINNLLAAFYVNSEWRFKNSEKDVEPVSVCNKRKEWKEKKTVNRKNRNKALSRIHTHTQNPYQVY